MKTFYVRVTKMNNGSTVVIVGEPEDEEIGCGFSEGTGTSGNRTTLSAFLAALGGHIEERKRTTEFLEYIRRETDKISKLLAANPIRSKG